MAAATVFHIAHRDDWNAAAPEYRIKSLQTDGFIHCSDARQVIPVVNRFYKGQEGLVLLAIDTSMLQANLRYDEVLGEEERFPHLYGALNRDAVIAERALRPGSDGSFELTRPLASFLRIAGGPKVTTAEEVIALLGLEPLPREGGFFVETFRTAATISVPRADRVVERNLASAIYFFLTPETFSALHRLPGSEIYHFYQGDPVEMLMLDGKLEKRIVLGPDVTAGMICQITVNGGAWHGSRLIEGGTWALMGTTMAPGFDSDDLELGDRVELSRAYPRHVEMIRALTR